MGAGDLDEIADPVQAVTSAVHRKRADRGHLAAPPDPGQVDNAVSEVSPNLIDAVGPGGFDVDQGRLALAVRDVLER